MKEQTIRVSVDDRVATVTIDRPEQSNAFSTATYGELSNAIRELGGQADVGAVVITGAGKHFSAGGDIKRFKALTDAGTFLNQDDIERISQMCSTIRDCPKPVIAMVNGTAAGAGFSCALACDFRVVQPSSKMSMAFVNLGLSGDTGAIFCLMRQLPPDRAELLMMLGEAVKGRECVDMGLATLLAEEGQLAETAYELARKLAAKSSCAHGAQKRLIRRYFYNDLEMYYKDEAREIAACSRQPDFTEAVNAFGEKRPPRYNKGGIS